MSIGLELLLLSQKSCLFSGIVSHRREPAINPRELPAELGAQRRCPPFQDLDASGSDLGNHPLGRSAVSFERMPLEPIEDLTIVSGLSNGAYLNT
jgi:hypothetical protein